MFEPHGDKNDFDRIQLSWFVKLCGYQHRVAWAVRGKSFQYSSIVEDFATMAQHKISNWPDSPFRSF